MTKMDIGYVSQKVDMWFDSLDFKVQMLVLVLFAIFGVAILGSTPFIVHKIASFLI